MSSPPRDLEAQTIGIALVILVVGCIAVAFLFTNRGGDPEPAARMDRPKPQPAPPEPPKPVPPAEPVEKKVARLSATFRNPDDPSWRRLQALDELERLKLPRRENRRPDCRGSREP